jgi:hypothetical protein
MELRGYQHHSPVLASGAEVWPEVFLDPPGRQFTLLGEKYRTRDPGRIPLPQTPQELWAHHKYSVLARAPAYVRRIGAVVAARNSAMSLERLAREVVEILRVPPPKGRLLNALQHMWGYVSEFARPTAADWQAPLVVLTAIRTLTVRHQIRYLLESTALSDLQVWIPKVGTGAESMLKPNEGARALGPDGKAGTGASDST